MALREAKYLTSQERRQGPLPMSNSSRTWFYFLICEMLNWSSGIKRFIWHQCNACWVLGTRISCVESIRNINRGISWFKISNTNVEEFRANTVSHFLSHTGLCWNNAQIYPFIYKKFTIVNTFYFKKVIIIPLSPTKTDNSQSWDTCWNPGQPVPHSETLSQKSKRTTQSWQ